MIEGMPTDGLSLIDLEHRFSQLQARMITIGTIKGLSHPETIKCSQELDQVLNTINKMKYEKSKLVR